MTTNIIVPSSDADKKKIADCIREIDASMTRIDSEKDFIKEAIADLQDQVGVPKKYIAKMARIYHKQNLAEVTTEISDLEELYTQVIK
jgi:cell division protein FtsB